MPIRWWHSWVTINLGIDRNRQPAGVRLSVPSPILRAIQPQTFLWWMAVIGGGKNWWIPSVGHKWSDALTLMLAWQRHQELFWRCAHAEPYPLTGWRSTMYRTRLLSTLQTFMDIKASHNIWDRNMSCCIRKGCGWGGWFRCLFKISWREKRLWARFCYL